MFNKRLKEIFAISFIGDGTLALLFPEKHLRLWETGPDAMEKTADALAENPSVTRLLGAASIAAGIWLASRQYDDTE